MAPGAAFTSLQNFSLSALHGPSAIAAAGTSKANNTIARCFIDVLQSFRWQNGVQLLQEKGAGWSSRPLWWASLLDSGWHDNQHSGSPLEKGRGGSPIKFLATFPGRGFIVLNRSAILQKNVMGTGVPGYLTRSFDLMGRKGSAALSQLGLLVRKAKQAMRGDPQGRHRNVNTYRTNCAASPSWQIYFWTSALPNPGMRIMAGNSQINFREVPAIAIDDYVRKANIRPTFTKIDVEARDKGAWGYERVLEIAFSEIARGGACRESSALFWCAL
jgi:hypothetical protein